MAQHDYDIANDTAANVRADINNVLDAIVSNNSGASEPTTTFANMWWYDSSNDILKIRNETDTAWIEVGTVNQSLTQFEVSTAGLPTYAMDFIASATASNDATIEFTGFDDTKYDSYELEFINVVPATDDVNLQIRTSGDGGSTYDSGASDYAYVTGQTGSANANSSNGTTAILPTNTGSNNVGSASGEEGVSGVLVIHGPHVAARTTVTGALGYRNSVGNPIPCTTFGMRLSTADVNAVQVSFNSGNIESGTIILRGKRNS